MKWSSNCYHAVSHTNLQPKVEVEIIWQAPSANLGCVQFVASVLENEDLWYSGDGGLTKMFCAVGNNIGNLLKMKYKPKYSYVNFLAGEEKMQAKPTEECCACDEAKYEMSFTGFWSRQTHPKDFPTRYLHTLILY